MPASVNEAIRDALIPVDLDDRRVQAAIEEETDARLNRLERDLKALLVSVDPGGAQQRRSKRRRLRTINVRSRELINAAYSDINALTRNNLRRLARAESRAVALTVEGELLG